MAVFWVVTTCNLVEVYRFRGSCCLQEQGDLKFYQIQGATNQKTAIFVITAVRTSNPTK
jgi:hypothetical protein